MRAALALLVLAMSTPALAQSGGTRAAVDPEMTCGSEPVRQALAERLPALLCLSDNLKLSDLTLSLTTTGLTLTLADLLTTELTEIPLRRSCEAQLSFEAKLQAEALGPGRGIVYNLLAKGEARTITYAVGRFDDGRLYVRPSPGCWKIDGLSNQ